MEILGTLGAILYPFAQLVTWFLIKRHNRRIESKIDSTEKRVNGRLDELIRAKEEIAYQRGVESEKKRMRELMDEADRKRGKKAR
jgi:hypothetical protein